MKLIKKQTNKTHTHAKTKTKNKQTNVLIICNFQFNTSNAKMISKSNLVIIINLLLSCSSFYVVCCFSGKLQFGGEEEEEEKHVNRWTEQLLVIMKSLCQSLTRYILLFVSSPNSDYNTLGWRHILSRNICFFEVNKQADFEANEKNRSHLTDI